MIRPLWSRMLLRCGTALPEPRSEVPPPAPTPILNGRHLGHVVDVVKRVEYHMAGGEVLDRVLARRKRLGDLFNPPIPGILTPEIVDP